jgi:serine/threonine protein kinase/tetratricopeptide (TPR) repeat protein
MPPELAAAEVRKQHLRQACAELDRLLRAGQASAAEDEFARYPELAAEADCALELIYTEFVVRDELGQRPDPAQFYARFPRWRDRLERLLQVHAQLGDSAPPEAVTRALASSSSDSVADPVRAGKPGMLGDYELVGEIGHGGMGVVYRAWQKSPQRLVALKMILAGDYASPAEVARFRREAVAVARLQHPNIVQIHEVGESGGRPYFSLEYVDGGNLADRIKGVPQAARPSAQLVQTLARAVHYAHQRGVVHRDLKPANILLASGELSSPLAPLGRGVGGEGGAQPLNPNPSPQRGEGGTGGSRPPLGLDQCVPKIADFGLAKLLIGGDDQTRTGDILGTPSYIAPEQVTPMAGRGPGRTPAGPAADVYALGAILYELLTGRPPFRGEATLDTLEQVRFQEPVPPRRLQPKVPRDLETICLKCLEKEPAKRYASAEALAEDLGRFLNGEPVRARPVGRAERLWRWGRRNPVVAGLLALVAALLVGVSVGSTVALFHIAAARDEADRNAGEAKAAQAKALAALDAEAKARKREADERKRAEESFRLFRRAIDDFFGVIQDRLDEAEGKQPRYRRLTDVAEHFLAQLGDDPRLLYEAAKLFERVGLITRTRADNPKTPVPERAPLKAESLVAYQKAAQKLETLVGADLKDTDLKEVELRRELARSYIQISNLHGGAGQLKEALKWYQKALDLYEGLVRSDPKNPEYQLDLADAALQFSSLHRQLYGWAKALPARKRARELLHALADRPPADKGLQNRLAQSLKNLGSLQAQLYEPKEALASYKRALALYKEHPNPDSGPARASLANLYLEMGRTQAVLKDPDSAQASFGNAIDLRKQLSGLPTAKAFNLRMLAKACEEQAQLLLAFPKLREGVVIRSQQEAVGIYQKLAEEMEPKDPIRRKEWATATNTLAVYHSDPKQAVAAAQQAIKLWEGLIQAFPENREYRGGLAQSYRTLGNLHAQARRPDEALRWYDKAVNSLKEFVQTPGADPSLRWQLAQTYLALSSFYEGQGKLPQAIAGQQKALDQLVHLKEYQLPRARSYQYLARLYLRDQNKPEAIKALKYAASIWRQLLPRPDEIPHYRDERWGLLGVLAGLLRDSKQNRLTEAAQVSLERKQLWPTDPERLYHVAVELATCARLVGKGGDLTPAGKVQRQYIADQAVAVLREAIAHGFRDAERLQKAPAFNNPPLSDRDDFKKVLSELQKSAKKEGK